MTPAATVAATRGRSGSLAAALLVVTTVAAIVPVAVTDEAAVTAEAGNTALAYGDWNAAENAFTRAAATDPGFLFYSYELASVRSFNGETKAARSDFDALATVDRSPWVLISLARLDMAEHDLPAALENARAAYDRGYGDAEIALNVGAVAEAAGDLQLAEQARANAVALAPSIAGSSYWASTATPADLVGRAAHAILLARGDAMSLMAVPSRQH